MKQPMQKWPFPSPLCTALSTRQGTKVAYFLLVNWVTIALKETIQNGLFKARRDSSYCRWAISCKAVPPLAATKEAAARAERLLPWKFQLSFCHITTSNFSPLFVMEEPSKVFESLRISAVPCSSANHKTWHQPFSSLDSLQHFSV